MAKSYFKKVLLTTRVKLSNGKSIPWVDVGWNTGALETEDELMVSELTACAKAGRGGIVAIDEATFSDLKKNSEKFSRKQEWQPLTTGPEAVNPISQQSLSLKSEKSSEPAVVDKSVAERSDEPPLATGVFDTPPTTTV